MAAVLLLLVVAWAVQGALPLPGHVSPAFRPRSVVAGGAAAARRAAGVAGDVAGVRWSSACAPRLALLRRHQDAVLQCELYAPPGTTLTWLKDGHPFLPKVSAAPPPLTLASSPFTVKAKRRQCRRGARKALQLPTDDLMHVSTGTYIDCASADHQGHYTLKVTTPSRNVYTRNFTVALTGEAVSPANTCFLGPEVVAQIPRVWHYVRRVQGSSGGRLVLPCRVLDQGVDTTIVWHFRGARLLPSLGDHKHEVLASGDLVVRCLEPRDAGLYTCTAYNTHQPYLYDRVHTWLTLPRPKAPARPAHQEGLK